MRYVFALSAPLLVVLGLTFPADAQKIDANGRCHAADGKMAKMEVCKGAAENATRCRDVKTKKFAKCGTPGTEVVPSKADTSDKK